MQRFNLLQLCNKKTLLHLLFISQAPVTYIQKDHFLNSLSFEILYFVMFSPVPLSSFIHGSLSVITTWVSE